MLHTQSIVEPFLPILRETWLFQALSDRARQRIEDQLQLCVFEPGELIDSSNEAPIFVHCVVQGRVRILGPGESPTLAIAGPGTLIGWERVVRRVAIGSVRAALPESFSGHIDVTTLAIPVEFFETIIHDLPASIWQRTSHLEIFDVLSHFLVNRPIQNCAIDLKSVVQIIEAREFTTVESWSHTASQPLNRILSKLSPDFLWFVSSNESVSVGTVIDAQSIHQLDIIHPQPFPIRLLGIDRAFIETQLLDDQPPEILPLQRSEPFSRRPSAKKYPIWRSRDSQEDVVACFGMICEQMNVPYRPDTLRRLLKQTAPSQLVSPDLYLRIAQAIGLNASLVPISSCNLHQLSLPAIVPCSHIFTVVYRITPTQVILVSPRTGLLKLKPDDFVARLSLHHQDVSAIVLERFPTTPTRRFGWHWFVPMVLKQKGILTQVLVASIVIQLFGLANPLLVQQVVDHVIINANSNAMSMFGSLMIGFALLEGILTIARTYLLISSTNRMDLHLGVEIIRHLLHLPLSFFEKRPVGELSARLSELETIRQFMTDTAITTVMDVVFSVFYIGVMFLYSAKLTGCVLLSVPIVIISMLLMSSIQQRLIRVKADRGAAVQSYLVEVLSGMSSVKSQHMENLVEATWRDRYVHYLGSGFTSATINTIFYSYSQFLNTASSLLVLWVGANLVVTGELSLGSLIAFRILAGYVTGPLLRLARLWQRFQETSLSMELLADIANSPAEEELSEMKVQLPAIAGHVSYQSVEFGFKPGQSQVSNVSLDIAAGTFVGIVGQSGSGKSTLMKLLPRLYLPQLGQIRLDGYDISKVELSSLRSQVGIVSQDAILFQGTIRDNIALFSDFSDDQIIEAAQIADAHDFIMELPDGYATQVGERGAELSGGQRQRIAIARVVARNPRLLIFDEATSALDYMTERRVCENLMQRFGDRTCFFITHRLNTILQADWILLMQSGKVAEQGTHSQLMERRQRYYALYSQQTQDV